MYMHGILRVLCTEFLVSSYIGHLRRFQWHAWQGNILRKEMLSFVVCSVAWIIAKLRVELVNGNIINIYIWYEVIDSCNVIRNFWMKLLIIIHDLYYAHYTLHLLWQGFLNMYDILCLSWLFDYKNTEIISQQIDKYISLYLPVGIPQITVLCIVSRHNDNAQTRQSISRAKVILLYKEMLSFVVNSVA